MSTRKGGRIREYDDFAETVVRQMVECVKVFDGGKVEVVFGGGYAVEERIWEDTP